MTFSATFDGAAISTTTLPVRYDLSKREIMVYSEDPKLIGMHTFTLSYRLVNYPTITTTTQTTQVQFIDPCIANSLISSSIQTSPAAYLYDGTTLTFKLTPFTVDPPICSITYSCAMAILSPRTDLCNIISGSTVGAFSSATGDYTFTSTDTISFPEGSYTFSITGKTGT